jgi:hypothetical protein
MSSDEEFADFVRARTLGAFGLKAWRAGLAPVPLHVRIWRAVTSAYRRGRAVDWSSCNTAETEFRERQRAFAADLPGRAHAIADLLSESLPDGLRFEYGPPSEADAEAVAGGMGIDPAIPMTQEQHAEFSLRMSEPLGWNVYEGSRFTEFLPNEPAMERLASAFADHVEEITAAAVRCGAVLFQLPARAPRPSEPVHPLDVVYFAPAQGPRPAVCLREPHPDSPYHWDGQGTWWPA